MRESVFVSASESWGVAFRFATPDEYDSVDFGYLYKIKTTRNMFSAEELGHESSVSWQKERFSFGPIHDKQVVGYWKISKNEYHSSRWHDVENNQPLPTEEFVENPDYDEVIFGKEGPVDMQSLSPEQRDALKEAFSQPDCIDEEIEMLLRCRRVERQSHNDGDEHGRFDEGDTDESMGGGSETEGSYDDDIDSDPDDDVGEHHPFNDPCKRSTMSCEHEAVAMDKDELEVAAEKTSKETYESLMSYFEHDPVLAHPSQLHPELNERFQGLEEVSRMDRISTIAADVGRGGSVVAGLALYGYTVEEVFKSGASALDKAEVVTSIIPVIGCTIRAADNAQRGGGSADTALCFAQDALILSGQWELAVVLALGEALYQWASDSFAQDSLYDPDLFRSKRLEGWQARVKAMEGYIGSDGFLANVTTRFSSYRVALIFQAARAVGDVDAALKKAGVGVEAAIEAQMAESLTFAKYPQLERDLCEEMARSKLRLQKILQDEALAFTQKLVKHFDDRFFDLYWKSATKTIKFLGFIPFDPPQESVDLLRRYMDGERRNALPLYQARVHRAIKGVIDKLKMPAACRCKHQGRSCEYSDCASPAGDVGAADAAGRELVAKVMWPKEEGISEECGLLFSPCLKTSTHGDFISYAFGSKDLWCQKDESACTP